MTTQDTWPSLIPGDQMQPFQDIWNTLSRRSIFPVADNTERDDVLIPWLATKGMEAPSADNPLYVHNKSLPVGAQLQSTVDGSAWATYDGRASDWEYCPIVLGGWTFPSGIRWSTRQDGRRVDFAGTIANSSFTGGFTKLGTIGAGSPAPIANTALTLATNSGNRRSAYVSTSGDIFIYAEGPSSAWWVVGGSYRIA